MAKTTTTTSGRRLTELLDSKFMARLDSLDVTSRKIFQGKLQGERRSKRRGQSVEFADHRPYSVGDDLRFVDWNIYGRLEQLFMKLFIEEQDLTVHIAFDVSGSIGAIEGAEEPDKITKEKYIKKLAAALGYVSLVNNSRVTFSAFGSGEIRQLPNIRGRNYIQQMAEFLLTAQCQGSSDFDNACRQIVSSRQGSGVMIILSDFIFKEGYDSGLRRLIGRNYDLYTIQVLSKQELDPQLTGDLKLIDVEDGDAAEVTVSTALLKYYKRNLTSYCNELKDFCTRRGGHYILANSSESVETMVLNYLRRIRLLQ